MPQVAAELNIKSSHAISWVDAMSKRLAKRKDVDLAIVTPTEDSNVFKTEIDGVSYYLLKPRPKLEDWMKILDDFHPDVIHMYGTEKEHNLPLIMANTKYPIIVSLQGILTEYERFYYGGIDIGILLKNITIRDLVRGTVFKERKRFQDSAVLERQMLCNVKYVEGRTDWDRVAALDINPNLKYYHCPRLLREAFYSCDKWDYDKMEKFSIFVHQGNYPIKGLHFMLEALAKLKKRYPEVRLYVAGNDIISKNTIKKKMLRNGYSKYLKSLVDKYNLSENITFTGYLSAEKLAAKLTRCNVMVIPSAIENSPNSLAEAELVGIPCVASYVGGNAEMLHENEDGFLYCYNEPGMLADKISQLFDSPELCESFSEKAKTTAAKRHNPEKLENCLLGIYEDIVKRGEY